MIIFKMNFKWALLAEIVEISNIDDKIQVSICKAW